MINEKDGSKKGLAPLLGLEISIPADKEPREQ